MMRAFEILDQVLARRAVALFLVACVAFGYSAAYFSHPLFPGFDESGPARGWLTWTDQNRYLVESLAIVQLRLDAASYFYPIGYPLLGAVFVKWMPNNPFFVPDLVFIVAASMVWWQLARRWLNPTVALVTGLVFVFTHSWLVKQTMVVPWNTIPTLFTLLAGIEIVLERSDQRAVRWLAFLGAVTYIIRPIDAVAFTPLLIFATLRLPTWRARLISGATGLAIVGAAVIAIGCFNLWLVGQWQTVYELVSTRTIGFFSYPTSYKLFWLLVDGRPLLGEVDAALFFRYPWLFLGIPAVFSLIRKEGPAGIAVFAAMALNALLYLNYNDLLPSDIYRFTLIHYLTWIFPLLFLLVVAACRDVGVNRWIQFGFALSIVLVVVCIGLRLEPERLETPAAGGRSYSLPETRPLLVEFPGVSMESIALLRVDERVLVEYSEYLVPYVPSDLKLLLGTKTQGSALNIAAGSQLATPPLFSRYGWRWSLVKERLNVFAERKNY